MWLWGVLTALTLPNMMVLCMNTNSEYEASWGKTKYNLAMEPYVYRHRFPRKVYHSEPNKGDSSLKAQERIPRSDSLLQPRLIHFDEELELPYLYKPNKLGIKSRLKKRKELRRVIRNDAELQILDMDPLQLKEALILGLRSLAKRQSTDFSALTELSNESVLDDLSETSLYSDDIQDDKLSGNYEGTQAELAKASLYTNEKHKHKFKGVSEHESNYPSKSSLSTDDKHEDKLTKGSESKLKKRSETPFNTKENHDDKLIDGSESLTGLSNPSLFSNNKHEDKLIESSEIFTAEVAKTSDNTNEKYKDKFIESSEVLTAELAKTSVNTNEIADDKLLAYSEIHKGPYNIEFQIESANKKDEEYVDGTNDKGIVNVYQEKADLHSLESRREAHPKKHVRVKSYQDHIDEPPMLKVKTLSEGRNLEISNFLTPDKNSINSIDSQMSFNVPKESKIIDISKVNHISEDNSIADEDSIIHKTSEKSAHNEALSDSILKIPETQELIDVFFTEEKSLENSKEEENENDKTITTTITDFSAESNNSDEDNQKDKHYEDSNKSKGKNSRTKDKEKKKVKYSNESSESSSESTESAEEVKPVKIKPLPPCPDYMDLNFRVDRHKGVSCSSDDDCNEEGQYCCQAYSNLNKCWSNLSSEAMNVTPSE